MVLRGTKLQCQLLCRELGPSFPSPPPTPGVRVPALPTPRMSFCVSLEVREWGEVRGIQSAKDRSATVGFLMGASGLRKGLSNGKQPQPSNPLDGFGWARSSCC